MKIKISHNNKIVKVSKVDDTGKETTIISDLTDDTIREIELSIGLESITINYDKE